MAEANSLIHVETTIAGGEGLVTLAEQNLRDLGFTVAPSAAAQAVAISLAFCQQYEISLIMELNSRIASEAEATGQSFSSMLFDAANKTIYAPAMKAIDTAHKQAASYTKQLKSFTP